MSDNKFDLIYESIKSNLQMINVDPATDKGLMIIKEDISKPIYIVSESVGKKYLLEEAIFLPEKQLISEGIFDIVKEKLQSFIEKIKSGLLNVINKGMDILKSFCEKILNSSIVKAIRNKLGLDEKFTEDDCKECISCLITEAKDTPDNKPSAEIKIDTKKVEKKIQKVAEDSSKEKKNQEEIADEVSEEAPTKEKKEKSTKDTKGKGINLAGWIFLGIVGIILLALLICYLGSLYYTILVPFIKGAVLSGPENIIKCVVCGTAFFMTYRTAKTALKKGGFGAWGKFFCMACISVLISVPCLSSVFKSGNMQDRIDWYVKSFPVDNVYLSVDEVAEIRGAGHSLVNIAQRKGVSSDKIDSMVGRPHNIKTVAKRIGDSIKNQFQD